MIRLRPTHLGGEEFIAVNIDMIAYVETDPDDEHNAVVYFTRDSGMDLMKVTGPRDSIAEGIVFMRRQRATPAITHQPKVIEGPPGLPGLRPM